MLPGQIAPAPGLYADMSAEDYHTASAISKSRLDQLHRSPAHLYASFETEREETEAMKLGSLFHCLVLEPELYELRYMTVETTARNTKAGKDAVAAAESAGLIPMKREMLEQAQAMARAIHAHPTAGALLGFGGISEVSIFWEEVIEGITIPCKARIDRFIPDLPGFGPVLLDLKKTRDASPRAMPRHMAEYRYHVQAAWYRRGLFKAEGITSRQFSLICVEDQPPYPVTVFNISEGAQQRALSDIRTDLATLSECIRSGEWPGYPTDVLELDLPDWAYRS